MAELLRSRRTLSTGFAHLLRMQVQKEINSFNLPFPDRLYRLKKRPDEKPLGLFIAGAENVSEYAQQTVPNGLLKVYN